MTDDWYVKRFFLARNRNEEEALKMIIETMKWRKSINLLEIKDYTFPKEFYKIGGLFIYEEDKNGCLTVYIRVKMHRKIPELEEVSRKFLIHTLNKADLITRGNGIAVVFDVTGAGYKNLDWDYLKFLISSGTNYFPVGVKYILVLNVPWALNAFRRMALSFLPEQWFGLLRFASGDEVYRFIDRDHLPDYLGGTCKKNFRAFPPDSKTISEVVEDYGYSQDDINRILPEFRDALDESEKALRTNSYIDPSDDFFDRKVSEKEAIRRNIETADNSDKKHYFLLNIVPNPLITYDPREETYVASLLIFNPSKRPVAFKIQSTNPHLYSVSHPVGIVLAMSLIVIKIKFDSSNTLRKDKFRIVCLPARDSKMNRKDFDQLWAEHKDEISDAKFRLASFDSRCAPLSLIRGDSSRAKASKDLASQLVNPICDVNCKIDHLSIQMRKLWVGIILLFSVGLSVVLYFFMNNLTKEPLQCLQDTSYIYTESHR